MRTRTALTATVLAFAAGVFAQTTPAGWRSEDSKGIRVLTPPDLNPGEAFQIVVTPDSKLGARSLGEWLQAVIRKDPASAGGTMIPKGSSAKSAIVLVTKAGVGLLYTAVSTDGLNARLVRLTMSEQPGLYARYKAPTEALVREVSGNAAASVAPPVAPVSGKAKLGGPLQEGVYVGEQTYGGKHRTRFKLWLYANREYRIVDLEGVDRNDDGDYTYDPTKGFLNISRSHWLTTYFANPKEDFCFFARDAAGRPMVYAKSDRGFSDAVTTLLYAGKVDRPSPSGEKAAKAAAEAEAARYKFVVAPGKGLPVSQVAAVIHDLDNVNDGMGGITQKNSVVVLLADGTAHDGFPVPFDVWDVPTSRRREPATWGRWKRSGTGYQVAFGGAYRPLKGEVGRPAARGTRLAGRWGTGESSVNLANSSYRLWGITFTQDGGFVKDGRGGAGTSLFMSTGTGTSVNTQYDDKGSYTSATTPNAVVGAGRKGGEASHRSGTYSLDGYTLTLRYADGRVARIPFFMKTNKYRDMWFEGAILAKGDK